MKKPIGRLAFRQEGNNWNAYYALQDTMEGAIFLGSIAMAFCAVPERKAAFMALVRACLGDLMEARFGVRPDWQEPVPAPEHERSGSA
jgi:hypothetical protein